MSLRRVASGRADARNGGCRLRGVHEGDRCRTAARAAHRRPRGRVSVGRAYERRAGLRRPTVACGAW